MSALMYIVRKRVKNSLRELLKKPGKLVMYLLVVAAIVGAAVLSFFTDPSGGQPAPMFWFTGLLFLFIALLVIITAIQGLKGGNFIFEMSDVNFLFVSPINPRTILLYGVVNMIKTAFWAGFFVLFQTSTLGNFGIEYGGVLLTFAGIFLSLTVLTIASLLIYSITNGKTGRKLCVKCLLVLLFLPLLVYATVQYFMAGDVFTALEAAVRSPFLQFVPVAGWTASGVTALLTGETLTGMLMLGMNLLFSAGMIIYVALSNPDYYEDVLVATETYYEKKRALAEGNINAAAASPEKKMIKISRTGISGRGAMALFGKHILENFRQNRFGFITIPSLLTIVSAIFLSFLTRDLFVTLQVLIWLQIFLIGTGRGLKETYLHYIYLIPESSYKKILWSNMEVVVRTLVENILIFGVSGFFLKTHLGFVLVYIVVYTLYSFLLLGVNYLFMRFAGANLSAGFLIMIYYFSAIAVMLPGAVSAIFIGTSIGGDTGLLVGLLIMSGWELAAGLVCFALARGVLHNCDMAMIKENK